MVIWGVAMAGMDFSPSYTWLILLVLTGGLGVALFSPTALGMISDSVPAKRQSTTMGIYVVLGECNGIIAGTSSNRFIWTDSGYQYTVLTTTVAAALKTIIHSVLMKDKPISKL